ncbi:hypothetical protein GCM10028857_18830 [Salinarchaeum chitinilyticum]
MVWIKDQVKDAIIAVLADVRDGILAFSSDLFVTLIGPIVGVPAPEAGEGYVVASEPVNHPWGDLYGEFYLPYVLGLTFALAFLGFAFVGLRSNALSPYERKRLLRRLLLVTVGALVWFPFVSVLLQFVDSIGLAIAPVDEMTADFQQMTKSAIGGVFAGLLMATVSNVMLLVAALGFALRYLAVVVLTLLMPLLGVFWALDTWPLSTTAEIARKAAAVYPGLVLAGLPAAILLRIGYLWDLFGDEAGLWDLLLALMFIPTACIASLMTVYWSTPAIKTISQGGARAGVRAPSSVRDSASSARESTRSAIQGGRNVHRGFSDGSVGAVRQDGQTTLGSGDSTAYRLGDTASTATDRTRSGLGRVTPSGPAIDTSLRDRATTDAQRLGSGVKRVSKHRLQRARRQLSWK